MNKGTSEPDVQYGGNDHGRSNGGVKFRMAVMSSHSRPRIHGRPRPARLPSSESASAKPMLINYGGPIVTAGGLVFMAATNFDRKFRAFDKKTGKLLWEATLPFPGNATPAT
jgi:hypothetical protein